MRRAGRFDREIEVGLPNEAGRKSILNVLTRKMKLEGQVDLDHLARRTAGYVGADLAALCKEAALSAVHRVFHHRLPCQTSPAPLSSDA